jgi:hypothetical protein
LQDDYYGDIDESRDDCGNCGQKQATKIYNCHYIILTVLKTEEFEEKTSYASPPVLCIVICNMD